MNKPSLGGVVETALYVTDLDRSSAWYERVFGFERIMVEEGRLHAHAITGNSQVLLLFAIGRSTQPTDTPGGRIPPHDASGQQHLCFRVTPEQQAAWLAALTAEGIAIESEVNCPGGGHSIYFRDLDGHLLEFITPGCWKVY